MKDSNNFDKLSKNTKKQSEKSSFEEFMANYKPIIDLEPEDRSVGSDEFSLFSEAENYKNEPTADSYVTRRIDIDSPTSPLSEDAEIQLKIKETVNSMKLNSGRVDTVGVKSAKVKKPRKKIKGRFSGPALGALYLIMVFGISTLLAIYVVLGSLDLTGLGQSDEKVALSFSAEQAADINYVSKVLKNNGVIKRPELFKIYAKRGGRDKKFVAQSGSEFTASMGYESILNTMLTRPRESVTVTFPEGLTTEDIAKLLEENKVCSRKDFLAALDLEYPLYSFLNEMPTTGRYNNRVYRLEGFLFPDTYEFYLESKATTVVTTFLDNFNTKVSTSLRAEMKTKDMNLYDVLIQASLVEWEAGNETDMPRVARVLSNRLANPQTYKKLECDSTYRYLREIRAVLGENGIRSADYDTYEIEGLMASPINNPGINAIKAVMNPSNEKKYVDCFFFVTNINDENKPTYFSKTYAEHDALCRKYKIGIYAEK